MTMNLQELGRGQRPEFWW